jgi:signal transduction histidine kinase
VASLKKLFGMSVFGALALAMLARSGVLASLFSANYLPHRYCYLAQPGLVWTNVASDGLIAISYAAIFSCLIWIGRKLRDIPDIHGYLWIFLSFGLFIVACGATHLMEVVTVWWPIYPFSAAVKVICMAASIPTAFLFARATPSLAKSIRNFLKMLRTTEQQRDQALVALNLSEILTAERQRSAEKLAAVNDQLNSVLECTSDGVMTLSREWVILYGNGIALTGLPDFRVGKVYWSCFSMLLGTISERCIRTTMVDRIETSYESYYAPYQKWHRVRVFPTDDGVTLFFSNITEEKKLRDQLELEQLLREKRIEALSHMAGGLAHEISNPLAIIHGRANDLMGRSIGDGQLSAREVHKACQSIVKTSDRAITILRGLKGFAREASKDPMEFASIYEIAEECMELQQARFAVQNIKVVLALESDIPLFLCREVQVGQILTNLLNNAFDSIVQSESVDRWVTLGAEFSNGDIHVDVTDSGPGIEDQFKAHLMEPFFTTKELGLGMGIGLSLSRAIAQDHRGSLILRPNTEHTCFRLTLPIKGNDANEEGERNSMEVPYQPA